MTDICTKCKNSKFWQEGLILRCKLCGNEQVKDLSLPEDKAKRLPNTTIPCAAPPAPINKLKLCGNCSRSTCVCKPAKKKSSPLIPCVHGYYNTCQICHNPASDMTEEELEQYLNEYFHG